MRKHAWSQRGIGVSILLGVVFTLSACGEKEAGDPPKDGFASSPERSVDGKEQYYFESLPAMAEKSDAVVRGRVVNVEPGRTYGESKEDQVTMRNVTVEVLDTVKGNPTVHSKLTFEEEGWDGQRDGYVVNGMQWSAVGDEAFYYFEGNEKEGWRVICSYGRYTLKGKPSPGPSGHHPKEEGPWTDFKPSPGDVDSAAKTIAAKAKKGGA
jgi:hypothetical protein